MSMERNRDLRLERDDQMLIEQIAEPYAPNPPTEASRAAFDERLWARIEEKRKPWVLLPALVTAAVAAAFAAWLILPGQLGAPGSRQREGMRAALAEAEAVAEWERELFYVSALSPFEEKDDESELLPDDYLAIASVFLDG
jgi:hypothetical protein